jgi:hypothetical protein
LAVDLVFDGLYVSDRSFTLHCVNFNEPPTLLRKDAVPEQVINNFF